MEALFLISLGAVVVMGVIGIQSRHYLSKLAHRAWEQRKRQAAYIKESEHLTQLSVSRRIERPTYERLRKELDEGHTEWYEEEKRYMNTGLQAILLVACVILLVCISMVLCL